MRRQLGLAAACLLPIALAGIVTWYLVQRSPALHSPPPRHVIPVSEDREHAGLAAHWLNGVDIASYKDLDPFEQAAGEHPQVVGIYVRVTDPFPATEVKVIERQGAEPLIQLLPRGISVQKIADGDYDTALRAWAAALRKTGQPVILSFAHEMNGPFFSWGCEHTTAAAYIAAWRHVHAVLGTRDITWLWNVNEGWSTSPCALLSRWPGAAYVNWVGIDGYLRASSASFGGGLGYSIRQLETRTGKPVLLAEGGVTVGQGGPARMQALYAGARSLHCLGIVYFDSATRKGDYRPQDNPAALAAFRKAISDQ